MRVKGVCGKSAPWRMAHELLLFSVQKGTGRADNRFLMITGGRMDVLRIILSVLIPPLGVFLQVGFGLHFWLNILLTLLGYFPGLIHAVWIILRTK
jgi:uncharacterized membrane protein YqaE (UPF0057 family)